MSFEEELGYPHELILSASNRTASVISGGYRTRIKLLANLLSVVLNKKRESIKVENRDDPELLIFENLSRSSRSLKKHLSKYKEKIDEALKDFKETESEPSFTVLRDLLKDGIFLHILCKELNKSALFLENDFTEFSTILDNKDNSLYAVFSAIHFCLLGRSGFIRALV